jgi:hypothetical protein
MRHRIAAGLACAAALIGATPSAAGTADVSADVFTKGGPIIRQSGQWCGQVTFTLTPDSDAFTGPATVVTTAVPHSIGSIVTSRYRPQGGSIFTHRFRLSNRDTVFDGTVLTEGGLAWVQRYCRISLSSPFMVSIDVTVDGQRLSPYAFSYHVGGARYSGHCAQCKLVPTHG